MGSLCFAYFCWCSWHFFHILHKCRHAIVYRLWVFCNREVDRLCSAELLSFWVWWFTGDFVYYLFSSMISVSALIWYHERLCVLLGVQILWCLRRKEGYLGSLERSFRSFTFEQWELLELMLLFLAIRCGILEVKSTFIGKGTNWGIGFVAKTYLKLLACPMYKFISFHYSQGAQGIFFLS